MSEFYLLPLGSVISSDELTPLMSGDMYKSENFMQKIHKNLQLTDEESKQTWLIDGVDCEVLMVGSAWKKGKVRINIAIEFCEEE
jgi:hypothetical protein